MRTGLGRAVFDDLGQGQHQPVAGTDQFAVAVLERLFELAVELQEFLVEHVGAVLGFLQPQRGLHARAKLNHAERLGEEVIRPGEQDARQLVATGSSGEHDDLEVRRRRPLAQPAQNFLAAVARQVDVEQDEVVGRLRGQLDGVRAGPGLVASQPLSGQRHAAQSADVGLVVDDQDAARARGRRLDLRLVGAATVGVPREVG